MECGVGWGWVEWWLGDYLCVLCDLLWIGFICVNLRPSAVELSSRHVIRLGTQCFLCFFVPSTFAGPTARRVFAAIRMYSSRFSTLRLCAFA